MICCLFSTVSIIKHYIQLYHHYPHFGKVFVIMLTKLTTNHTHVLYPPFLEKANSRQRFKNQINNKQISGPHQNQLAAELDQPSKILPIITEFVYESYKYLDTCSEDLLEGRCVHHSKLHRIRKKKFLPR